MRPVHTAVRLEDQIRAEALDHLLRHPFTGVLVDGWRAGTLTEPERRDVESLRRLLVDLRSAGVETRLAKFASEAMRTPHPGADRRAR